MVFDKIVDRNIELKIKPYRVDGVQNEPILFCNVNLVNPESYKGRRGVHIVGLTLGEAKDLHKKLGEALTKEDENRNRHEGTTTI